MPSSVLAGSQGKCVVRPGRLLDLNLTIEVHGSLKLRLAKQCQKAPAPATITDPLHCRFGDHFSPTSHDAAGHGYNNEAGGVTAHQKQRRSPVCRLNHFRPEFFVKCPKDGPVPCYTYRGQRGLYVAPDRAQSSLSWAAPLVHQEVYGREALRSVAASEDTKIPL